MIRSRLASSTMATALQPDGAALMDRQNLDEAAAVLADLAGVFLSRGAASGTPESGAPALGATSGPNVDARYRALVEQMPAIVFMAHLDDGVGELYVSPQIEAELGFSREEWLEDPIRWYQRIHPDDKARWSEEAAEMFVSGEPLRSAYRVMARDGRTIWFHCQAAMVRRDDGRPWFVQGVAIDITDLKRVEQALQEERNLVSTVLDTVGALVVVLDPQGRIVRFNRACERTSGRSFESVRGAHLGDLFETPEESTRFRRIVEEWGTRGGPDDLEGCWLSDHGERRIIAWSGTVVRASNGAVEYIIATGNDITERRRLERALLDASSREQRRIGQDLHDGLGQHLTGTAFMSKVLQQRLEEHDLPAAAEASKIVRLVNEAIEKTRELSRGLVPVVSDADGLMGSLQRFAGEVENLFSVSCRFVCDAPVLLDDVAAATHLFHIAQEAVSNAIKHGQASSIAIVLTAAGDTGRLSIEDNGLGFDRASANQGGMGLHIMGYRANMIGGSFDIKQTPDRAPGTTGTTVGCNFPIGTRS
jgi:PAS domain S-box-containing protein